MHITSKGLYYGMDYRTYFLIGVVYYIYVEDAMASTLCLKNKIDIRCLERNYKIPENAKVHNEAKKKTNVLNVIKRLRDQVVTKPELVIREGIISNGRKVQDTKRLFSSKFINTDEDIRVLQKLKTLKRVFPYHKVVPSENGAVLAAQQNLKGLTKYDLSPLRNLMFESRPKRPKIHQDKKRSTKAALKRFHKYGTMLKSQNNQHLKRRHNVNGTSRDVGVYTARSKSSKVTGIGEMHSLRHGINTNNPFTISEHASNDESTTLISRKRTRQNDTHIIPDPSMSAQNNIMRIKDDNVNPFTLKSALWKITPQTMLLVDAVSTSSVPIEIGDKIKPQQASPKTMLNVLDNSLSKIWQVLIPQPKLSTNITRDSKAAVTIEPTVNTKWKENVQHFSNSVKKIFLMERKKRKIKRPSSKIYTESDHRPSAIGIGSFGALVLIVITVGIVILDISTLYRDFRRLKRRMYNWCKPLYRSKCIVTLKEKNGERWAYVITEGRM